MNSDTRERLESLHTAAIDARNGYREAVKDANRSGDLVALFRTMAELHESHASRIRDLLARGGEPASDDGSFMSTVHRTIMDVRAMFGGLDESVLPGLIDGEKRNLSRYDEALNVAAGDAEVAAVLTRQRDRLQSVIAQMQSRKAG